MQYSPLMTGSITKFVAERDGTRRLVPDVLFADSNTGLCLVMIDDNGGKGVGALCNEVDIIDVFSEGSEKPCVSSICETERVVIMGGGPCLASDLSSIEESGNYYISVNHHALSVVSANMVCFCDYETSKKLNGFSGHRVSIWGELATLSLDRERFSPWFLRSSPFLALMVAESIGRSVVLAGFDLYQSGKYVDGSQTPNIQSLEEHLEAWKDARSFLREPHKFSVVSGPLVDVFGGYDERKAG